MHEFELLLGIWRYDVISCVCGIFGAVVDAPYLNWALEEQLQEGHSHLNLPHLSNTPCHYSTPKCKTGAGTQEPDP